MCWATALLCGQPKKAHGCLRTTESRGHPPRRRHRGARCKHTSVSIGDSNAGMGFDHPVTGSSSSKVLLGPNSVVDRRRRRSCWARTRSSTDASCRRTAHRGCRARAPAFTHRISVFTHRSAQSAQSVLLACLCARASVNFPPAQIDRSLTSATLRFCNDGVDSASRSRAQRSCRPTHNPSSCFRTFEDFKLFFSPGP
jgi:hypothetical protein